MASKIGLRRSRTPRFMHPGAEHGDQRSVMTSEPSRAKIIVSAIGANSSPDGAGERVDRQEPGHDHGDRVEDRPIHLGRRLDDHLADVERLRRGAGHLAEDVLDHHHGAVHQDAEVDRADRQQVGGNVLQVQADEGEEQRQRNRHGHDQPGAQVVEEEDQDHDDQQHAAQQVVLDGAGGERHEVAAIVERVDLHVLAAGRARSARASSPARASAPPAPARPCASGSRLRRRRPDR